MANTSMLLGANLSAHHDPIMSYSTNTTPLVSPHGIIGERIQPPQFKPRTPDLSGLSIRARDDISVTNSHKDRDSNNDIVSRGPFETYSRWSNKPNDHNVQDDGWDRASANHFASRPQSPRKGQSLFDIPNEPPKTALPTFPAFTPIITPPAPQSLLLPPHPNSTSPPRDDRSREVVKQASQHLSSLQALIGPLVGQLDDMEQLKQDLALWKASSEAGNMEILALKAKISSASLSPAQKSGFNAIIVDGDTQIFHESFLKAGPQGGQAAAQALVDAVKSMKDEFSTLTAEVPILVHVFLDKAALGNTLIKAGLVASWPVYEGFWQGFSASVGLVSVIDVGTVKDASQVKIQAYLEHYLNQSPCTQIILASNNDIQIPSNASSKLALIGHVSIDTTHKTLTLPHIFRTTPLPQPPPSFSSILTAQPPAPTIIQTQENGSNSTSSSSEPNLEVTLDWEEVPKNSNSDDWTEARKKQSKRSNGGGGREGREGRERGGRRALAGTGNDGRERREKRGKRGSRKRDNGVRDMKPRPCHTYYLSPSGCQNNDCHYGHEYELDDDQCQELSILAKQIPCPFARNKKCHYDNESCTYGHKCPRGRDCIFEDCRFDIIDPDHHAWE